MALPPDQVAWEFEMPAVPLEKLIEQLHIDIA